ncbi:GntR family transcriptional regulator [Mycolicibacterium sediminis]|uniref:GntR family transcriptional regulator n=1 Tax=Mycolicibacterium sediminis TaxID=1286180 RepID=A0A7I7QLC9_9MYCO|nr:GntR family transcriptional regulator [Mycolicibacterium sediminis]BBY27085.1 GntR family transcriptional regulator [Mycolicibacterium sediminis]
MEVPLSPTTGALRRAMRDDVRDAVLAMLMDGRLAAGTSVSIDQLARDLNVSQTPVREALVEIEATGLVQRVARRGYQVAPPMNAQQAAELADARLIVETVAARWAARLKEPDLLPQLRAAHRTHEDAAWAVREWDGVTRDRNQLPVTLMPYFNADWGFHQTILDHCGNGYLRRMVGGLGASVQRMRQNVRRGPLDTELAVAEHARVLAAIEAGDPPAAEAAMRAHIEAVRERSIADA